MVKGAVRVGVVSVSEVGSASSWGIKEKRGATRNHRKRDVEALRHPKGGEGK